MVPIKEKTSTLGMLTSLEAHFLHERNRNRLYKWKTCLGDPVSFYFERINNFNEVEIYLVDFDEELDRYNFNLVKFEIDYFYDHWISGDIVKTHECRPDC